MFVLWQSANTTGLRPGLLREVGGKEQTALTQWSHEETSRGGRKEEWFPRRSRSSCAGCARVTGTWSAGFNKIKHCHMYRCGQRRLITCGCIDETCDVTYWDECDHSKNKYCTSNWTLLLAHKLPGCTKKQAAVADWLIFILGCRDTALHWWSPC